MITELSTEERLAIIEKYCDYIEFCMRLEYKDYIRQIPVDNNQVTIKMTECFIKGMEYAFRVKNYHIDKRKIAQYEDVDITRISKITIIQNEYEITSCITETKQLYREYISKTSNIQLPENILREILNGYKLYRVNDNYF